MGCGKTTLGKKIANGLNYRFIDSDKEIESALNTTVSELFKKLGEDQFRNLETLFVNGFNSEFTVLATGGGLPCFNDNINKLKELGLVVYLKRPAKELVQRLINAKQARPLIAEKSEEELYSFITNQLKEREAFYNQADLILNREEQAIENAMKEIKKYTENIDK